MTNYVYIATSLDGYIADKNNDMNWLISFPNPESLDLGYDALTKKIDALLMGRKTFDFVVDHGTWPYTKHVFVLSNSLTAIPKNLEDKATLVKGDLTQVVKTIKEKGYNSLYVDGGTTIQGMFQENMIDELIITLIPILLGGGYPLFGELDKYVNLRLINTSTHHNGMVQLHYKIIRDKNG